MEYKSESDFLAHYNKDAYEKLSMTTDIVIFSVSNKKSDNYRKLNEKFFSVLLVKRHNYPYKDKWCLPGGFLDLKLELEDNARNILKKETNLQDIYLEQLYTFGGLDRDPRLRVVATSYMALIDKERLNQQVYDNAKWFNIFINEKDDIVEVVLESEDDRLSFKIKKTLKELTTDRYRFDIIENDSLAFDHPKIILAGLERLKNKIEYTDIVFNMMPPLFTLGELKQVYEVILNKKLLDPAFRRIIATKVEKTDELQVGGGHRPSVLYRYKSNGDKKI